MTQEDKELLLKDLCVRLPYAVRCYYNSPEIDDDIQYGISIVKGFQNGGILIEIESGDIIDIEYIKPYLRPMSSMTEKEDKEYTNIDNRSYSCPKDYAHIPASDRIDWLNKNMFDYRGLIERNLALEAPEGIYNLDEK